MGDLNHVVSERAAVAAERAYWVDKITEKADWYDARSKASNVKSTARLNEDKAAVLRRLLK